MSNYDGIEFDEDAAEAFFNDLDTEEVQDLIAILASLDRLEMVDGKPRYNSEEIAVIGKAIDFAENNQVGDEDEDEDDLDEEEDEVVEETAKVTTE